MTDSTTPKPETPSFEHHELPEDEINKLAQALLGGSVFTSQHLKHEDPNLWASEVAMVWLPIGLGMLEQPGVREAFVEHRYVFYEYLDKASPRSVNGYPCFFSVKLCPWEQWLTVVEKFQAAEKAIKEAGGGQ